MRRRRAAIAAGSVIVCWAAAVAVVLAFAASHAISGELFTNAARRTVLSGAPDEAARDLTAARDEFRRAGSLAGSPVVLPVRIVPLVGRQVASFVALARAGAHVVDALAHASREVPTVPRGNVAGDQRVRLLASAARVAAVVRHDVAGVTLGPRTWLLPPLADRRAKFAGELAGIENGADALTRLVPLMRGPTHLLVLAANNGEMRAGSGMFLSAGELTIDDGHLSLDDMTSTVDLRLPDGRVPLDPDMRRLWSWLHPNQEWRNVNVTPRFDVSARLAASMWEALGRGPVDDVVAIDPLALHEILRATGPVDVDGMQLDAANVVRYLLHDQYVGVPLTDDARAARRDRLGRIAASTLAKIESGTWDPPSLVRRMAAAAAGRHLLLWSRDPGTERAFTNAGLAGRIDPSSVAISLLNRNGTKLDQFMHIDATLSRGTLRIRVQNATPADEPPYIAGPHPLSHSVAGEYNGILLVTLPGATRAASVDNERRVAIYGRDGPSRVIGIVVDLRRGAQRAVVVRFEPPRIDRVTIVPSARVAPTRWHIGHTTFGDRLKYVAKW